MIKTNTMKDSLSEYYRKKRKRDFVAKKRLRCSSIMWRRIIHPLLLFLIKLDRIFSGEKCIIIHNRSKNQKNLIYACTHIGGNDVQRVFEAIRDHAYLLLGDPGELYRNYYGGIIYLNGAICLETRDKVDRRIAEYRTIELLRLGGSILLFPEGAWNIEPSAPVMHLFKGTVRMARKTGKDIVPIAVEYYDDKYFVNVGNKIHVEPQEDDDKMTGCLRDVLSTLKWQIWERQGLFRRSAIQMMTDEEFALSVVNRVEWEGYTLKDVYETRYHVKSEEYRGDV